MAERQCVADGIQAPERKGLKRRGILAAAGVVVAGLMAKQAVQPVAAASGGGDQGFLALGSNPWYIAGNPINPVNQAAVSSAPTVIQASPNFNNYAGSNGGHRTVFEVDARPTLGADVTGIVAWGAQHGPGLVGNGNAGGSGVQGFITGSSGNGVQGVVSGSGGNGVRGQAGSSGTGVKGTSLGGTSSYGVWGETDIGYGVVGSASTGTGVYGTSSGGNAVYGYAGSAGTTQVVAGVLGDSTTTYGMIGRTTAAGYSGLTAITGTAGVAALAATSTNAERLRRLFHRQRRSSRATSSPQAGRRARR